MNIPENERLIKKSRISFAASKEQIQRYKFLAPDSIIFPKRGAAIGTNKKRITKKNTRFSIPI